MKTSSLFHARHVEGLTFIELIIVLAIMSILAALVAIGPGFTGTERLRSSARELLADLQSIRFSAMTQGPDPACAVLRGAGIRFESKRRYHLFRFNDANRNFAYDGIGEERPLTIGNRKTGFRDLAPSVEMKIKKGGTLVDPDNAVLLFDHSGIPRQKNFGFQQMSIVFHHSDQRDLQKKCVSVSFNRVREGIWHENECREQ